MKKAISFRLYIRISALLITLFTFMNGFMLGQSQPFNQLVQELTSTEILKAKGDFKISDQLKVGEIQREFVRIDHQLLFEKVIEPKLKTETIQRMGFRLFKDSTLTITTQQVEKTGPDQYNWIGYAGNESENRVIVVIKNKKLTGNIRLNNKLYQVRPIDGDIHVVYEIDPAKYPNELDPDDHTIKREDDSPVNGQKMDIDAVPPDREKAVPGQDSIAGNGSEEPVYMPRTVGLLSEPEWAQVKWPNEILLKPFCGPVIDVLVMYTDDAAAASADIDAEIALAISETNDSYENSGIQQRLRLAHSEEVSYTESGNMETDRNRLKSATDGILDNVHSLRWQYAADVVSLWVENGGDFCGIAYIMEDVNTDFANSAFSVVQRGCATGNYSFGHELGHLMSARHDWFVDDTNNSPYSYNHGYVNTADRWRTIMAYNNACTANPCTRLPYWSNPDVTYGGDPMGIAEGHAKAADNRKTLNNTAATVASFRDKIRLRGGEGWGADNYATDIAFGDVDNDGRDEVGITRKATGNARWWILDDAKAGFSVLKSGGIDWGSGTYATAIAFGNVDNDPAYEFGITRYAGGNARWWILDDKSAGFAIIKSGGSDWGEGNYPTDIAFGDTDNDGRDEVGITRNAGGNARWWILDDAVGRFVTLQSGGSGWGADTYATAIAFGNVDNDPAMETGLTRKANENNRWWILDDAKAGYAIIKSGGDWGSGNYPTDIAFGDVDKDGRDELGIARKAGENARWWVLDDAIAGYAVLKSGGENWGEDNYATAIAFGDVDNDQYEEFALIRKSDSNNRYWVFDDFKCNFNMINVGGYSWGNGNYGTSVSFGNVDGTGGREMGITRKAGTNHRYWVIGLP